MFIDDCLPFTLCPCLLIRQLLLVLPGIAEGLVDYAGEAMAIADGEPQPLRLVVGGRFGDERQGLGRANDLGPGRRQVLEFNRQIAKVAVIMHVFATGLGKVPDILVFPLVAS